jgi:hypothetical protein
MTEPARPLLLHSNAFHEALVTAGVIRAGEHYRRIVIDAQQGEAVVIYAERVADDRLLGVALTLDGIEIREQVRT